MCTRGLEEVTHSESTVSLLSVPCKILCRLLIDRVKSGVDEMIRQEQAGFRS